MKILIAEDHPQVRANLRLFLESENHVVSEAADEATAAQLVVTEMPEAAIVDIALPPTPQFQPLRGYAERCGLRLAARLKRQNPRIGIVFYSNYSEHRREVLQLIFEWHVGIAYLLKGCLPAKLLWAVQETAQGGIWIDPEVAETAVVADELLNSLAVDEHPWVEQALAGFNSLTPTEVEVISLLAASYNNQGIAEALGMKPKNVENHVGHIYDKTTLVEIKSSAPNLRPATLLAKAWLIHTLRRANTK
jgi:DNA-binding NarL/FixJ family response regulator